MGVGLGVGAGVGVGVAVGAGVAVGDGDADGAGDTLAVGWIEAPGVAAVAGVDGSHRARGGRGDHGQRGRRGVVAATGRSMPPRASTKPKEIPADRTSSRIAARVARGSAAGRRGARADPSTDIEPRRYRGQSAWAVRRHTSSCCCRRLGARRPDRDAAVVVVGRGARRRQDAVGVQAEERTHGRVGRAGVVVEHGQRGTVPHRFVCARLAGARQRRFVQLSSLPVGRASPAPAGV